MRFHTKFILQYLSGVLLFILSACATSNGEVADNSFQDDANSDVLENIKVSEKYIDDTFKDYSVANIPSLITAITNFSHLLDTTELDNENIVRIKNYRAYAYWQLARVRYLQNNKEIILEEIEQGIEDYDFVLTSGKRELYPNTAYHAGFLANNYTDDKVRAGKYWKICADHGHAGCMNTIATGYLLGKYGLERDIQKAINYHQRSFKTGINYQCAGAYSGIDLADIATMFPDYQYDYTWQEYLDQSFPLYEKLVSSFSNKNSCEYASVLIIAYTVYLEHDIERNDLLEKAIEIAKDDQVEDGYFKVALANYFLGKTTLDEFYALSARKRNTDYTYCSCLITLIYYKRIIGDENTIAEDVSRILNANQNECSNEMGWLRLLNLVPDNV